jgi:predicted dehydrogenase
VHAGRKFGFEKTTTDIATILDDPGVNAVVIATRHDSHGDLVCRALEAGKHVFVEKPLALVDDELAAIEAAREKAVACGFQPLVTVGFNRRFAPQVQMIKGLLAGASGPKSFIMTVNAGAIPADHWTQDPTVGGGRILGEACHFIDLLRFLAAVPIAAHHVSVLAGDTVTLTLSFIDGSIGTVHYFANGSKSFPKERLEVFASGRILQLDNFRRLKGFGWPGFRQMNLWRQDKGQKACAAAFVEAVGKGGAAPIPVEELIEVSKATIELAEATRA